VEKRTYYWVLDCVLTLTAVALGTAALCSFAGVVLPTQSGLTLGVEAVLCGAGAGIGLLFAGFLWRNHPRLPRRQAVKAHQEQHAMMIRRELGMTGLSVIASEPAKLARIVETPETLLVTSLTGVKAQRRAQRRHPASRHALAVSGAAA